MISRSWPATTWPPAFRRALTRHRRKITAALVGIAVAAALGVLAPAPADTRALVVAAADLAAGQVLEPGDVALSRYPADQVPAGSYARPEQVLGRALAGAVRRAEPLTDVRIVGPAALTGSVGLVEVAVRLADAGAAQLVRPGDTVDVLAATPDAASPGYGDPASDVRPIPASGGPPMAAVVASSVRVLAGPGPPDVGSAGSGGSDGALVVLAVTPATARVLAAAAAYARLSVLIRSGATDR